MKFVVSGLDYERTCAAVTALWECALHAYDLNIEQIHSWSPHCTPQWHFCKYTWLFLLCLDVFRSSDFFFSLFYRYATTFTPSLRTACQIIILLLPFMMMLRLSSACDLYQCTDRVGVARAILVLTYFYPFHWLVTVTWLRRARYNFLKYKAVNLEDY